MPSSQLEPRTLALGVWLAARGVVCRVALVLAGVAAGISVLVARSHPSAWQRIPYLTAACTAWSVGVTLAYGCAMRAVQRDADAGVLALARARGIRPSEYARGRVAGLTFLVALAICGATIVAGIAASSVSPKPLIAARETMAAVVYALAFSVTVGPLALASLGGRSRVLGYLLFVAVLSLPEAVSPWTAQLLPNGWHELTSIPAALEALRSSVSSLQRWPAALRALTGLAAVALSSLGAVGLRARLAEHEAMP